MPSKRRGKKKAKKKSGGYMQYVVPAAVGIGGAVLGSYLTQRKTDNMTRQLSNAREKNLANSFKAQQELRQASLNQQREIGMLKNRKPIFGDVTIKPPGASTVAAAITTPALLYAGYHGLKSLGRSASSAAGTLGETTKTVAQKVARAPGGFRNTISTAVASNPLTTALALGGATLLGSGLGWNPISKSVQTIDVVKNKVVEDFNGAKSYFYHPPGTENSGKFRLSSLVSPIILTGAGVGGLMAARSFAKKKSNAANAKKKSNAANAKKGLTDFFRAGQVRREYPY